MKTATMDKTLSLGPGEISQVAKAVYDAVLEKQLPQLEKRFAQEVQSLQKAYEAKFLELTKELLNQMHRGTITKSIVYDGYGRPERIVEQREGD